MSPKVTEAERVEVGRYYMVPCVRGRAETTSSLEWIAVTGPEHEDRGAVFAPYLHWHPDCRFMSARMIAAVQSDQPSVASVIFLSAHLHRRSVEWRRQLCKREMPPYPPAFFMDALVLEMGDARLKPDCRTCPHRGVPLNGLPVRDGAVTCPGHGLRWNLATGEMVRRDGAR